MNIDEAIKILNYVAGARVVAIDRDRLEAIKLGCEALKAYQKSQEARWYPPGYKLPGETKD